MKKFVRIFLFGVLFYGCSSSKVITSWKSSNYSRDYRKIMVIGIVKDSGLALRRQMETHLVDDLNNIGYSAVSALNEFGENGLSNLQQEETYVKLCNKGIDAVITVALLDRKKEKFYVPARVKYYSNLYYYNRIWNYDMIQADLVFSKAHFAESTEYAWESILFDLQTLSPVYTVQTKTFDPHFTETMAHEHGQLMVNSMIKNKVLTKKNVIEVPLKAF